MKDTTPYETIKQLQERISFINGLSGNYIVNYYNDNGTTIQSISLPIGLCHCYSFNYKIDEYEYSDVNWSDLSEYTKIMVLLEVADKYFKQNKND